MPLDGSDLVKFSNQLKKGDEVFIPVFHTLFGRLKGTYQSAIVTGFSYTGANTFIDMKVRCLLKHNKTIVHLSRQLSQVFPVDLSLSFGSLVYI